MVVEKGVAIQHLSCVYAIPRFYLLHGQITIEEDKSQEMAQAMSRDSFESLMRLAFLLY